MSEREHSNDESLDHLKSGNIFPDNCDKRADALAGILGQLTKESNPEKLADLKKSYDEVFYEFLRNLEEAERNLNKILQMKKEGIEVVNSEEAWEMIRWQIKQQVQSAKAAKDTLDKIFGS